MRLRVCGGVDTGGGWEEGRKPEKGLVEDSEGRETGGDTADAGGRETLDTDWDSQIQVLLGGRQVRE